MHLLRLATIACITALTCGPAAAQSYHIYAEPTLGTAALVPAGWRTEPMRSADQRRGRFFVSPDGDSWLAIYGTRVESRDRLGEAPGSGLADERVTYSADGRNWFVRSGFKQDRIFYRKAIFSCGGRVAHLLAFEYPAAEKRAHDELVTRVAQSLRAGRGTEAC